MSTFYEKYHKYKEKYLLLKNKINYSYRNLSYFDTKNLSYSENIFRNKFNQAGPDNRNGQENQHRPIGLNITDLQKLKIPEKHISKKLIELERKFINDENFHKMTDIFKPENSSIKTIEEKTCTYELTTEQGDKYLIKGLPYLHIAESPDDIMIYYSWTAMNTYEGFFGGLHKKIQDFKNKYIKFVKDIDYLNYDGYKVIRNENSTKQINQLFYDILIISLNILKGAALIFFITKVADKIYKDYIIVTSIQKL